MNKITLELSLKHANFLLYALEKCIDSFNEELKSNNIDEDRTAEIENDLPLFQSMQRELTEKLGASEHSA